MLRVDADVVCEAAAVVDLGFFHHGRGDGMRLSGMGTLCRVLGQSYNFVATDVEHKVGQCRAGGSQYQAATPPRIVSTQCTGLMPVPCSIWCRQLNPQATTLVPGAHSRTAGNSRRSPIFSEIS